MSCPRVTRFDPHRYDVRWRFVAADEVGSRVRWRWEVWTPSGVLVARSGAFSTLGSCERDAALRGYWAPPAARDEQRELLEWGLQA